MARAKTELYAEEPAVIDQASGDGWTLYNGDSAVVLPKLPDKSVHLTVSSPPFIALYTYSDTPRDLGNCATLEEFMEHFRFIAEQLLRVTHPGCNVCFHIQDVVTTVTSNGVRGIKDFTGPIADMMQGVGFAYCGKIPIDKNPQALTNGTPVMTPSGWIPIECVEVGDMVFGADGKPHKILNTFSYQNRVAYRVRFHDGTFVDCDSEHLWAVRNLGGRNTGKGFTTKTTQELIDGGLRTTVGHRRYEIPLAKPCEFESQLLPIDPYMVGALIGDGNLSQRSTVSICAQSEIVNRCKLPSGQKWRKLPGREYANGVGVYNLHGDGPNGMNLVLSTLYVLGLQGKRAWEKFIPKRYLQASVENRRELLRGLLDTDGRISLHTSIRYHTVSPQLADDVASLVRSLGGVARQRVETARGYVHNGEKRNGRPLYEVVIGFTGEWNPFTLPSKAERFLPSRRQPRKMIESIEAIGRSGCTCIEIDSDDHTFITKDYIVTHNCQAARNKVHELMFATKNRDARALVPVMVEYIQVFKAPGKAAVPVVNPIDNNTWIDWAHGIWPEDGRPRYPKAGNPKTPYVEEFVPAILPWYDIRETDVLNSTVARESLDERHMCPLQLGLIDRLIRLYTNEGEVVLDPFSGISSTGYQAVKLNRRSIGIELKPSYFRVGVRNMQNASASNLKLDLFDEEERQEAMVI